MKLLYLVECSRQKAVSKIVYVKIEMKNSNNKCLPTT